MIFRKAKNGELKQDSGLQQLYESVNVLEIDVSEAGVKGAKTFFEAQVIIYLNKQFKELIYSFVIIQRL